MSRQAINNLVSKGILPVDDDGKIDLDVARTIIAAMNPAKSKAAAHLVGKALEPAAEPPPPAGAAAEGPGGDERDEKITSYHVARTLKEAYGAKNARLEYLEKVGKLVDAEDVRRAAYAAARAARDALMSLPARLSAILAAESDPARVHDLIAVECRKICEEIAAGDRRQTSN